MRQSPGTLRITSEVMTGSGRGAVEVRNALLAREDVRSQLVLRDSGRLLDRSDELRRERHIASEPIMNNRLTLTDEATERALRAGGTNR